jgi:hypothetical protein
MNYTLVGAAVLVAAAGLLVVFLLRRWNSPAHDPEPSLEWCTRFTVQRYRPMERLFSEDDDRFLAAQPGCSPRLMQRLRADRRRIFRHYLRCLSRDFNKLHRAARYLLLDSPQDRPDLVMALFRQRLMFRYALLTVHGRLALQTLGLGSVNPRGLVSALELMGSQFRQLAAVPRQSVA